MVLAVVKQEHVSMYRASKGEGPGGQVRGRGNLETPALGTVSYLEFCKLQHGTISHFPFKSREVQGFVN